MITTAEMTSRSLRAMGTFFSRRQPFRKVPFVEKSVTTDWPSLVRAMTKWSPLILSSFTATVHDARRPRVSGLPDVS